MTPKPRVALAVLFTFILLSAACGRSSEAPAPATAAPAESRQYLLERVDDAAIVQLYADGFSALPLKDKTLIWHLYRATQAGRDIFYDQHSARALEMREVLEAIVAHPAGIEAATLAEIQRYTKLFWINTGPYNNLTARKFVLTCTPDAFRAAAQAAAKSGAQFPTAAGESLDSLLDAAATDVLRRRRGAFRDDQDAAAWAGRADRQLQQPLRGCVEARRRGFQGAVPAELAAGETRGNNRPRRCIASAAATMPRFAKIVEHLEAAKPFATAPMAAALDALIQWYRTGEAADRRGVRHRVGRRSGVARGHHQRLYRNVSRCPWREGFLGRPCVLREHGEDRSHSEARA